jgi:DNA-binding protein Fis
MDKFVSASKYNKNILQSALLSINLPVNILIIGNIGVGKKLLAKEISNNIEVFYASKLEKLINNTKINLSSFKSIIVLNINELINKIEFFKNCSNIKLICTSTSDMNEFTSIFAIKLYLKNLIDSKEDFDIIKQKYINDAKQLSNTTIDTKNIDYDLSNNGISLKKSIYKSIFYYSMKKIDLKNALKEYFYQEVQKDKTYYDLLEIFEIPLIEASTKAFKSQVQMSNQLNINRVTLRKKISRYKEI